MDADSATTVEGSDILAVFDDHAPAAPLTAAEVAAVLECSPGDAATALGALAERGAVGVREVGDHRVWWRAAAEDWSERFRDAARRARRAAVGERDVDDLSEVVCDRLAAACQFATVCRRRGERFVPRARAGVEEAVLQTFAADDAVTDALCDAVDTGGPTVTREAALPGDESGAFAAAPITYLGAVYGVLGVYVPRDAFADAALAVLSDLGRTVGHAVTAIECRKALLADRAREVEFRSHELAAPFADVADGTDWRVSVERVAEVNERETLFYHVVTGLPAELYEMAVTAFDGVDAVERRGRDRDGELFQVRTTGETVARRLAAHGARLRSLTFEANGARIVAELPVGGDVRRVSEAVTAVYPDARVVAQRTTERRGRPATDIRSRLDEALTDRQLKTLAVAYRGGYFEWPRENTGEELAASLSVSGPTFHQHLRAAERKLLELVLDEED